MIIIPALDLMAGQTVRLTQGNFFQKTAYGDPFKIASQYQKLGATLIHVVDLDGARTGQFKNFSLILKLAKLKIPLQVGGGVRTYEQAVLLLKSGIEKVVLGTVALENFSIIQKLIRNFGPERVVVSIDVKKGKVAEKGWQEISKIAPADLIKILQKIGVKNFIYTDIEKDGTLTAPNFKEIKILLKTGANLIIAGGLSTFGQIKRLQKMEVSGVIIGKAFLEKKLNPEELLSKNNSVGNSQLTKRIIPCLDVKDGRVVKGINYLNLQDAGDPVELGKFYDQEGADELIFLDIAASADNRKIIGEMVKKVAEQIFIPFSVGGGIRTIEDIREILKAGADKVSFNTAAVKNPTLIQEGTKQFGSQCIVLSVDAKRKPNSSVQNPEWEAYIKGGRENTGIDVLKWIKKAQNLGAGEILLNSMDQDGTQKGYDLELLKRASEITDIPIIASSGAGTLGDFYQALTRGKADAVLAASLFHFGKLRIQEVKEYLKNKGIKVRL